MQTGDVTLLHLANDELTAICHCLDGKSTIRLRLVCRSLRNLLTPAILDHVFNAQCGALLNSATFAISSVPAPPSAQALKQYLGCTNFVQLYAVLYKLEAPPVGLWYRTDPVGQPYGMLVLVTAVGQGRYAGCAVTPSGHVVWQSPLFCTDLRKTGVECMMMLESETSAPHASTPGPIWPSNGGSNRADEASCSRLLGATGADAVGAADLHRLWRSACDATASPADSGSRIPRAPDLSGRPCTHDCRSAVVFADPDDGDPGGEGDALLDGVMADWIGPGRAHAMAPASLSAPPLGTHTGTELVVSCPLRTDLVQRLRVHVRAHLRWDQGVMNEEDMLFHSLRAGLPVHHVRGVWCFRSLDVAHDGGLSAVSRGPFFDGRPSERDLRAQMQAIKGHVLASGKAEQDAEGSQVQMLQYQIQLRRVTVPVQQLMQATRKQTLMDVARRYMRSGPPADPLEALRPLTGVWSGSYGPHGMELLQVRVVEAGALCQAVPPEHWWRSIHSRSNPFPMSLDRQQLHIFKLFGDPNVPSNEFSIVADLSKWRPGRWNAQEADAPFRMIVEISERREMTIVELAEMQMVGWCPCWCQINEIPYRWSPQWTDAVLLVNVQDGVLAFAIVFDDEGHMVRHMTQYMPFWLQDDCAPSWVH